VAEVASTFNEALLNDYMLKQIKDPATRLSLLGNYLEGMKGTVFRQTQFAEFELRIHHAAEKGEPLTGDSFDTMYLDIVKRYLAFLSAGRSKYPIDLLKDAGVDMTTSEPLDLTMKNRRLITTKTQRAQRDFLCVLCAFVVKVFLPLPREPSPTAHAAPASVAAAVGAVGVAA